MTGWKPGKRLTQKEFERRIYKLVEDKYVVKGDYINKGTKIGIQHYEPTRFGGMSLEDAKLEYLEIVKNDNIKNSYCGEEGIKLLRVPYYYTEEEIKNTVRSNVESPTPKSRIMI